MISDESRGSRTSDLELSRIRRKSERIKATTTSRWFAPAYSVWNTRTNHFLYVSAHSERQTNESEISATFVYGYHDTNRSRRDSSQSIPDIPTLRAAKPYNLQSVKLRPQLRIHYPTELFIFLKKTIESNIIRKDRGLGERKCILIHTLFLHFTFLESLTYYLLKPILQIFPVRTIKACGIVSWLLIYIIIT